MAGRAARLNHLSHEQLETLYGWIDSVPLSRPKRNIARDFSDGVLCAEIAKHYLPRAVDLHNYPQTDRLPDKLANWRTLNSKIFRKRLHMQLNAGQIDALARADAGAIEPLLLRMRTKLLQVEQKGRARTASEEALDAEGGAPAARTKRRGSKGRARKAKAGGGGGGGSGGSGGGGDHQDGTHEVKTIEYGLDGMRVRTEQRSGPASSPESLEDLMQMERYHELLLKKMHAEAEQDYASYAECMAAMEGFTTWCNKYKPAERAADGHKLKQGEERGHEYHPGQVGLHGQKYQYHEPAPVQEAPAMRDDAVAAEKERRVAELVAEKRAEQEEQELLREKMAREKAAADIDRQAQQQERQRAESNARRLSSAQKVSQEQQEEEEKKKQETEAARAGGSVAQVQVLGAGGAGGGNESDDWERFVDDASGREYYRHRETGELSWLKPGEEWVECADPISGKKYYFNRLTQKSSWVDPRNKSSGGGGGGGGGSTEPSETAAPAAPAVTVSAPRPAASTANLPRRASGSAALEPGELVWLKNARFNPARESPTNPAKWVAQIASFVPPGQYKLRWLRETATGSRLFKVTDEHFVEASVILKRIPNMTFDEAQQLWQWPAEDAEPAPEVLVAQVAADASANAAVGDADMESIAETIPMESTRPTSATVVRGDAQGEGGGEGEGEGEDAVNVAVQGGGADGGEVEAQGDASGDAVSRQGRLFSVASTTAITTLEDITAALDRMDEELNDAERIIRGDDPRDGDASASQMKSHVSQMSGMLEKVQFSRIDQVHVGGLNTGQEEARAGRKALNRRVEAMHARVAEVHAMTPAAGGAPPQGPPPSGAPPPGPPPPADDAPPPPGPPPSGAPPPGPPPPGDEFTSPKLPPPSLPPPGPPPRASVAPPPNAPPPGQPGPAPRNSVVPPRDSQAARASRGASLASEAPHKSGLLGMKGKGRFASTTQRFVALEGDDLRIHDGKSDGDRIKQKIPLSEINDVVKLKANTFAVKTTSDQHTFVMPKGDCEQWVSALRHARDAFIARAVNAGIGQTAQ